MANEMRQLSWLEARAEEATKIDCFKAINIRDVRASLESVLKEFGRNGFFKEYTTHDISHIDELFNICDRWLINTNTRENLTLADCLMITLAIYFHDTGLVITEDEFKNRSQTAFESFKHSFLLAGESKKDYARSVERAIPDENERERFYYQEFVRHYHGERIKAWLEGGEKLDYGVSVVKDILQESIGRLPSQFRSDLGLVCMSHHLDDLADTKKYKLNKPYGSIRQAECNLQFAAVVLRTADLLHITQDRAPSISFRLINPKNPISQREWYKQNAVTAVRVKEFRAEDGKLLPSDTIEIHAEFNEAEGYFGLDQYLKYAEDQLKLSHKWIEASRVLTDGKYTFPWQYIDKENIEAKGFLKDQFSFRMDEAKVLDLLTGYTLYNDPNIAIRELIQNSLDAIKLDAFIKRQPINEYYNIVVEWDDVSRILKITDNGTGMSQKIIENHFLKAGSSMYQEDDFKKNYPEFSSISRFGIGVLSCFMISDDIKVLTSHADDQEARELSLRSVHGSYLIKLIDKSSQDCQQIRSHGTQISMRIRDSISVFDIESILKHWIIFPHCDVSLIISEENKKIGFKNTKEALEYSLGRMGWADSEDKNVKIIDISDDNFNLSFAVSRNKYLKEWSFISLGGIAHSWLRKLPICTCVEGIRVEDGTPGFSGYTIPAVSNSVGLNSPRTNVARSGLEIGKEANELFSKVYDALTGHISLEIQRMQSLPNVSFSKAVDDAYWLIKPIIGDGGIATLDSFKFLDSLRGIPLILVDMNNERKSISISDFQSLEEFVTIEWDFMDSINDLIKNAPISITNEQINNLLNAMGDGVSLPSEPRLVTTSYSSLPYTYLYDKHICKSINVNQNLMRVDIFWEKFLEGAESVWQSHEVKGERSYSRTIKIFIGPSDSFVGIDEFSGVVSYENLYIKSESKIGGIVRECFESIGADDQGRVRIAEAVLYTLAHIGTRKYTDDHDDVRASLTQLYIQRFNERPAKEIVDRMHKIATHPEILFDIQENKRRSERAF
ncbi:HD domain-containing protein [Deinococcus kurensis]|uniref:HD domain-containing protein n=1 Tax=Deinococcus kurensis TaxID=2662757 RepID=UPI0012D2CB28|nr:ATP-binding protein [Deinococcus kurensis]